MKRVLIISPNFPPVNAADMQRVRQSLPYFREFDWEPVVIAVDENYSDAYSLDCLLLESIPTNIEIHKVKAIPVSISKIVGLGSLSIRSYLSIKQKGDELLANGNFDLVYFSTTAFHVLTLGTRWKKKFGVPFIVDMQDPWRNDYYTQEIQKKSLKHYLFHRLNVILEKKTIPFADGIISVSPGYISMYKKRYDVDESKFIEIPFGFSSLDFKIADNNISRIREIQIDNDKLNIFYVGRGGNDMQTAITILFKAIAHGIEQNPSLFKKLHFWFIGTSYAKKGSGQYSFTPIARKYGVQQYITESPDRISFFETLHLLKHADLLVVPGSDDGAYTASKIYPYLFSGKPLLAIFHESSSVCEIVKKTSDNKVIKFNSELNDATEEEKVNECFDYLSTLFTSGITHAQLNHELLEKYSARSMTQKQVSFFNKMVSKPEKSQIYSNA